MDIDLTEALPSSVHRTFSGAVGQRGVAHPKSLADPRDLHGLHRLHAERARCPPDPQRAQIHPRHNVGCSPPFHHHPDLATESDILLSNN